MMSSLLSAVWVNLMMSLSLSCMGQSDDVLSAVICVSQSDNVLPAVSLMISCLVLVGFMRIDRDTL